MTNASNDIANWVDGEPADAPDGTGIEHAEVVEPDEELHGAVTEPAKVMRIGSMVKQLLDEVRQAPLDEASRERLAEIYERSIDRARRGAVARSAGGAAVAGTPVRSGLGPDRR